VGEELLEVLKLHEYHADTNRKLHHYCGYWSPSSISAPLTDLNVSFLTETDIAISLPAGAGCASTSITTTATANGGSMYGWTGQPSPWTKSMGRSWPINALCLKYRSKLSFKSSTFGTSFVVKWTKSFQLQGLRRLTPHQGLCPGTRWGLHPQSPI